MQPEITLTYSDENGRALTVPVTARRFSIGRSSDNDLAIPISQLSRRHAVIEDFDGVIQVTDCGSQNGTAVNGEPLAGSMQLKDGDVITLGDACDITLRVGADNNAAVSKATAGATGAVRTTKHTLQVRLPSAASQPGAQNLHGRELSTELSGDGSPLAAPPRPSSRLSTPLVATAAVVLILAATGLLVVISKLRDNSSERARSERQARTERNDRDAVSDFVNEIDTRNTAHPKVKPTAEREAESGSTIGLASIERVEKAAVQVMRRISSDDKTYSFGDKALADITQTVEEYRAAPAVRDALRAMQQGGGAVAVQARREGIEPDLVIYAGLAVTDGGRTGRDPVAAARDMISDLLSLRATFGSGDADSSLLIIAAFREGGIGSKKSHPLLATIRRVVNNPLTQRNVWFLHERGGLKQQAYDFVLRFLALGVIAQNPRQFGLNADPLTF
jgi:hypothetical protein